MLMARIMPARYTRLHTYHTVRRLKSLTSRAATEAGLRLQTTILLLYTYPVLRMIMTFLVIQSVCEMMHAYMYVLRLHPCCDSRCGGRPFYMQSVVTPLTSSAVVPKITLQADVNVSRYIDVRNVR